MSNGSVGVISLDLIIKEKLGEQLEKIKSTVRSPAEKIGETIRTSIEKPIKNVGKAAAKTVSEAVKSVGESVNDDVESAIKRLLEREKEQQKALLDMVNSIPEKVSGSSGNYMKYNTDEIIKNVDKFSEAVGKPIKKTVEKANEALAELGRFEVSSDPVERLRQEINITGTQMNLLQKKWQELSAAEPSDKITAQLAATEQKIISTQDKLDRLNSEWTELESSGSSAGEKIQSVFSRISTIAEKIGREAASFITAPFRGIKNTLATIIKTPFFTALNAIKSGYAKLKYYLENPLLAVRDAGKKVFSALKTVGSKALGTIGKAAGTVGARFKKLGKSAASVTKPVSKLGNSLKRAFKSVFLMAGIYAAFKAVKNGLLEAANADEEFSKSLNAVKANLSIAFTPILQAIMPALNTLMSGLASVTKSVAGFIAGLFGTTYKQAAEATKKLKSVSDAAKKAKLSTAGIDEMNILSGGDDGSSDRSENQGIDYSNIDMSEPELPDWAQRLKDSIRSGDWAGVGAILAERVNSVLGSINWDKIQSKVNSGVTKITDLINGFLDNVNWETLGDTFAGGLNTITGAINTFYSKVKWDKLGSGIAKGLNQAIKKTNWKQLGKALSGRIQAIIDTAYSFVTTFNWSGFGNALGTAVNSWFDGIDFGKAGRTISEGIKGLLDTAINVVQTINWRQIGSKIAEFIGNIDFSGIVRRMYELLGSALGAAVSLLWGAIQNAVFAIRDYFSEKIEECGGNIIEGLFKGIVDALKSVGKWMIDNVYKPFIEGFKKAFGIHSPSKEMAVMGGYIIDGLFNAISDGIAKIKEIFSKMLETIKKVFSKIDIWFREKFSAAWNGIKGIFSGIGGWFSNRWNDIKRAFSTVGTWFVDIFQTAWNGIKIVFSKPGEFFGKVWDGIKSCFSHVTSWFRDTFSEAWQAVKDVFSRGGQIFVGIAESIADIFKDVVNHIIDGINWVIAQPFDAINDALGGIRDVKIFGGHPFDWLPTIDVPEIPRLAKGGLAAAPTLAMVGDNKNAAVDPEVIAPLSKLQGMLGSDNSEIVELLKVIIQLLRNGLSAEIIGSIFGSDFKRAVLKICADDKSRRFG